MRSWLCKSQELCETLLRASTSPLPAKLDHDALLQLYRTALCLEQLDSVDKKSEVLYLCACVTLDITSVLYHSVSRSLVTEFRMFSCIAAKHARQLNIIYYCWVIIERGGIVEMVVISM